MKYTSKQVTSFVLKHYSRAREWNVKSLHNWVVWMMEQEFCLLVGDNAKLAGAVFIRPVMNPQLAASDGLYFDPEGDCYFIDLAIATSPIRQVLQCFFFAALKRFGMRDMVARRNIGKSIVVSDAHKHRRNLLKTEKKEVQLW